MRTITKLKNTLDRWFSLYIRLTRSVNGYYKCFTCGKRLHYKEIHNGHFMSRRHLATRWDEINCQPQCPSCNTFNQGEQFKFAKNLDKKYGEGTADKLLRKSNKVVKMTISEYKDLIEHYKNEVKKIQ